MKSLINFVKQIVSEIGGDKVGQMSSAFAYAGVFALGPLLLVVVSVAGLIYGQEASQGLLAGKLVSLLGANTAKTVQDVVASTNSSRNSMVGLIVGSLVLLLTAGALLGQLQSAFRQIFDTTPAGGGIKKAIFTRLKDVVFLVIGCGLLVAVMVASSIITRFTSHFADVFSMPTAYLKVINLILAVIFTSLVISVLYQVVPRVKIPVGLSLKAGLVVGTLLVLGSQTLLGYMIRHNSTASAYGAAASLIALLLWFYYTAWIIFLGAEGIKVYGSNRGVKFAPKRRHK